MHQHFRLSLHDTTQVRQSMHAENQQLQYSIATHARGVDRKIFRGFQKGGNKSAGGLEGTAPRRWKVYPSFALLS